MRLPCLALIAAALLQPLAAATPPRSAGFDRNDYPGDAALPALHRQFAFAGYWLNTPPGAKQNTWLGHRRQLIAAGFGFLVLFNGRLQAEIQASHRKPEELGRSDAAKAIAAARSEGFPSGTVLFLDQEEGGRMEPDQAGYLFGWTEAVAASAYKPGAYISGQPVLDDPGPGTITSAQDIREKIAARHLHPIALWVAQDACPPAPGCVAAHPPALSNNGTPDIIAWQYAQSPRRKSITRACAQTYGADGNCYAEDKKLFLDLDVAASDDPSHGR